MKPAFDIADESDLNDENPDELETRTAELLTDVAGYTSLSERSIYGAWKFASNHSIKSAPQLRTSQRPT